MKITCPVCCAEFPIEAGLLEDDGKRFAVLLANMEPVLARAALAYLRLFRPAKTGLRTARAVKIVQELCDLVAANSVCRDERSGIYRAAYPAMWAQGIDQMLQQQASLETPLSNHNYLRKVVFGIADNVDAKQEQEKERTLRTKPRASPTDKFSEHRAWLRTQLERGFITQAEHDAKVVSARERHGVTD